jgi:Ca2+-binding EF-hand superfamily protein
LRTDDPAAGLKAAKSFYLAQLQAVAQGRPIAREVLEQEPTARTLVALFDPADRDGDGRLTRAELEALFGLLGQAASCRVVVTANDRGRNLFDQFDGDADGRLDLGELNRAARLGPIGRADVPAFYQLTVGRGPVGDSVGPVRFGVAGKPKPAAAAAPAKGPGWFRAADRNADGFVSPREFVGPPDHFAKLDADGDGRISLAEAGRAAADR